MSLANLEALVWSRIPDMIEEKLEKTAAPAWDVKKAVSMVFTKCDVGFYWNPDREKVAAFYRLSPSKQDVAMCKMAMARAAGANHVGDLLAFGDVVSGDWVKVAYSPLLRRTGELLNFFPGKYPGGYPNSPSPLAATLTSGLVGAGLGYGVGWLGEKVLPSKWKKGALPRVLAMMGGAAGAAPGAAWMYSAGKRGRSMTDGSDLSAPRGSRSEMDYTELPDTLDQDVLRKGASDQELGDIYVSAARDFVKQAFMSTFQSAYRPRRLPPTAIDVNINKMGQTLWEVGASPQTAATTMGALYAAQQLPDPRARPGHVTSHQTGLLGTMMGAAGGGAKGYATGWMVGKALNVLTGAPAGFQNTLKNTGAVLGIVNSVVPRLFH